MSYRHTGQRAVPRGAGEYARSLAGLPSSIFDGPAIIRFDAPPSDPWLFWLVKRPEIRVLVYLRCLDFLREKIGQVIVLLKQAHDLVERRED